MEIGGVNSSLELGLQILSSELNGDGLPMKKLELEVDKRIKIAHFLALKNAFPSSGGSNGITRSSARKRSFSLRSNLRASNGLNLPLSFVIPTTLETKRIFFSSSKSLYSL